MANNMIKNLGNPVNGQDAISLTYLSSELSNYAHINGTSFNGDIDMQNNRIFNAKNSTNTTSLVNRKYIDDNFLPNNKDISMGGFKITTNRQPSDLQELVSKGYVDQKVSTISSPVLAGFIKKDGSIIMESNFDLNNNKIINLKKATNNSDSVNLEQLNEATLVLATNVS